MNESRWAADIPDDEQVEMEPGADGDPRCPHGFHRWSVYRASGERTNWVAHCVNGTVLPCSRQS